MAEHPKQELHLHGNKAEIDPGKRVASLYECNTVTLSDTKEYETPIVDESNVKYAKKFVQENKK